MTTKKTKSKKEEVIDASLLPEIKSTASLNLALTKDDLVDILIDQEIKKLETTIQDCQANMKVVVEKIEDFNNKQQAMKDKEILSRIPKEFQALAKKYYNPKSMNYSTGCNSTGVGFRNSSGNVTFQVYNINTCFKDLKSLPPEWNENYQSLNKTIQKSHEKIKQLEKSPRRVKAQLLTQFLNNSDEGKNILSMLKQDGLKLIG